MKTSNRKIRGIGRTLTLESAAPRCVLHREDIIGAVVVPTDPNAEVLYIELDDENVISFVDHAGRARDVRGMGIDTAPVIVRGPSRRLGESNVYFASIPEEGVLVLVSQNSDEVTIVDDEEAEEEDGAADVRTLRAVKPAANGDTP